MNCKECKEKLVEYIEGLLDESQKQAVSEHLKNCQTCQAEINELTGIQNRLIKNSEKLTQKNFEDKVMNNILREQNVKLKKAAQAGSALKLRRNIMKSPLAKLAAAAIIIIAVLVGINPFKTSITLAQVIKPILNSRTIIFDMISGTDENAMTIHEIVVDSRIRRTMSNMPTMTMIIDMDNEKLLSLDN
ncbi:MAG: zf-HC2 domain-containing protein, partial [Sedimentisphaerales bacterium]|nr:zf-HC2 domain-containing protein [Sedimentisphaerales bacterium]